MSSNPTPIGPRTAEGAQVASDLRGASDSMLRYLDRLYELETRKRELPPDDPEFMRLAREVRDLAQEALGQSQRQESLATEVSELGKTADPGVGEQAIEDTAPGPREAMMILSDWRAAERRLANARAGSDEERRARADVDRLRLEYSRTVNYRGDDGLGGL